MAFVFDQPMECNLYLLREFYANWDPRDPNHEVKIRGKVVTFTAKDLNDLLGTPEADAVQLRQLIITPPYTHTRNFLCGTRSAACRTRQQGTSLHSSFPKAQINREARMWGKIVYHCLIQRQIHDGSHT